MNATSGRGREKKNNFLTPHNQSKKTQSKTTEYSLFRPELWHAQRGSICIFDYILSQMHPQTQKSHHEFTTLLRNGSFVRGIQIHYDLHPPDLLTFLQRPKLQTFWR